MRNFIVFGDSYSTFAGHIPEGFYPYYPRTECVPDMLRVEQTWWHRYVKETGATLVQNNSWSGSTICYTGLDKIDCSKTSSFVTRLRKLKTEGFFENNKIDTVLLFGGTNDSWGGSPVGELKYEGREEQDLYAFSPALCAFTEEVKEALPHAEIVYIVNTELTLPVVEAFRGAAKHYGVKILELKNIAKSCGHPTDQGMAQICEQVKEFLNDD